LSFVRSSAKTIANVAQDKLILWRIMHLPGHREHYQVPVGPEAMSAAENKDVSSRMFSHLDEGDGSSEVSFGNQLSERRQGGSLFVPFLHSRMKLIRAKTVCWCLFQEKALSEA
jgi:hypothetical protein